MRFALPLLALLCILLPSYHDAASRLWKYQEHAYAPLLTGLAFFLMLHRARGLKLRSIAGLPVTGFALSVLGAAFYIVGRSQQIELLELGACLALIAGVVAVLGGRCALRSMRFSILFLLFSLPYPGWLVDSLTSPLKEWISISADYCLRAAGYPIARSGVILALGPYQLMVADACSGLHSLIFLSALGLLYIHLTGQRTRWHHLALVAALLPIAVLANFVRVMILLLLTYHFGDAVGQGYSHDLAGLILFVCAFAMLTGLDWQLLRFAPMRTNEAKAALELHASSPVGATRAWGYILAVSLLLLAAAVAAALLAPSRLLSERRPMPDLERLVPQSFGDWRKDDRADVLLVSPDLQTGVERLYGQTLARTYVDQQGRRIMLSIAYGGKQLGNELQAHRPEYCYKAQGFTLANASDVLISTALGKVPARRLVARHNHRIEPVTYWMTVGEIAVRPGIRRKLAQLRYGLRGEIPDGMLIRISSLDRDVARAFGLHQLFIAELQDALPESLRAIVTPPSATPAPG